MPELRDHLTRYWITFEPEQGPAIPRLGVGVTAATQEDALTLVASELLATGEGFPRVVAIREVPDVSALDENHVLPNIGDPSQRGVWFPRR